MVLLDLIFLHCIFVSYPYSQLKARSVNVQNWSELEKYLSEDEFVEVCGLTLNDAFFLAGLCDDPLDCATT